MSLQKLNQSGQGMMEYLILVALVAVGTLAVVRVIGESIQVKFAQVAKSLGADVQGDIARAKVTESMWKKKDMSDFMQGSLAPKQSSGEQKQKSQSDTE